MGPLVSSLFYTGYFTKKLMIGVSPLFLKRATFGNFRVKFEENVAIFIFLYKKILIIRKRALSVS